MASKTKSTSNPLLPIVSGIIIVAALGIARRETHEPIQPAKPKLVIWSWEHDDNLQFVDSGQAVVAYYAGTIILGRENATLQRRKNFLRLAPGTQSFPVFRIEPAHADEKISQSAFGSAEQTIMEYLRQQPTKELQIDFDAGKRDRDGYLQFLRQLKANLPTDTKLSITALGSWCLYDRWLQEAPVNETVAMMFSMGKDSRETLAALNRTKLDSGARCSQSVGIAINERNTNQFLNAKQSLARAARIYAFSPLGWTQSRYREILATAGGAQQ